MKPFSYTRAEDTDAAIAIRSAHPQAAYLSGGTTLLDLMKDQVLVPDLLVDITRLPLRGIEVTTSGVHIGALTTMSEVAREPVIRDRYPMIAEALLEHTVMDANAGRIVNANLAEYLVPVHADIPAIDVLFVDESDFSLNPIGVKGLGEIGLVGVAPAIANAVYHATGLRIRDLPITLDKLLERDDATGKPKPRGSLPGSARRSHCSDDALSRPAGQAAKPSDREAGKEKE